MNVAIIGNGISGVSAARMIRKIDNQAVITIISAETEHFFSRTALMYIYMGHMRYEDTKPYEDWFWAKNRINLLQDRVEAIDVEAKILALEKTGTMSFDKLILATGSKPNKFGWPGQDLKAVQGLYTYQDLESMEAATDATLKRAVIVGGGLIGIEMAEMFHARHIPVTFLVRENSYWDKVLPSEESKMINREILANGIDLQLATELKEILGDENARVNAVITNKAEKIDCQFVGLTAGVSPNIEFLKASEIETDRGILVNDFLMTNIYDIYAIGDCAQLRNPMPGRMPTEAVWYTGRMMGECAAYNICGKPVKYDPGVWFNSAKFFDIEYQVYGHIKPQLEEGTKTLYWEHPKGKKSIRINYEKDSGAVIGFNLMGIRYRHEVCERWILNKTAIDEVLENLALANFDPEFFKTYEKAIIEVYNCSAEKPIKLKKKSSLGAVLRFLISREG